MFTILNIRYNVTSGIRQQEKVNSERLHRKRRMQLVATSAAAWWGSKVPRGWKSIFERRTSRGQPKLAASGTRVGHVPAFLRPIELGPIVCKTHGPVSRYPRAEQTVAARKNFTPDDLIASTWRNRRMYRISLARVRLYVGDIGRSGFMVLQDL